MIFIAQPSIFKWQSQILSIFCTCMHHTWFPPPTWAAIALQPRLAHPPPISWPCATTTCPPQSTLSRFFHGKPCQTGTHSKNFHFSAHWACTHTTHPLRLPPGVTSTHMRAPVHHLPGTHCPFSVSLCQLSVQPWLRSHYKPFSWGPMLLALHVCPKPLLSITTSAKLVLGFLRSLTCWLI